MEILIILLAFVLFHAALVVLWLGLLLANLLGLRRSNISPDLRAEIVRRMRREAA